MSRRLKKEAHGYVRSVVSAVDDLYSFQSAPSTFGEVLANVRELLPAASEEFEGFIRQTLKLVIEEEIQARKVKLASALRQIVYGIDDLHAFASRPDTFDVVCKELGVQLCKPVLALRADFGDYIRQMLDKEIRMAWSARRTYIEWTSVLPEKASKKTEFFWNNRELRAHLYEMNKQLFYVSGEGAHCQFEALLLGWLEVVALQPTNSHCPPSRCFMETLNMSPFVILLCRQIVASLSRRWGSLMAGLM